MKQRGLLVGRAVPCAPLSEGRRARSDAPYLCDQMCRQFLQKALHFCRILERITRRSGPWLLTDKNAYTALPKCAESVFVRAIVADVNRACFRAPRTQGCQ